MLTKRVTQMRWLHLRDPYQRQQTGAAMVGFMLTGRSGL